MRMSRKKKQVEKKEKKIQIYLSLLLSYLMHHELIGLDLRQFPHSRPLMLVTSPFFYYHFWKQFFSLPFFKQLYLCIACKQISLLQSRK
jgi:hypothetical protein